MPWWSDPNWSSSWSKEETQAWRRIWLISIPLLLATYFPIYGFFELLGMDPHLAVIVPLPLAFPVSFFISRLTCERVWPELVAQADKKAKARLGGSEEVHPVPEHTSPSVRSRRVAPRERLFFRIVSIGGFAVAIALMLGSDFLPSPTREKVGAFGVLVVICVCGAIIAYNKLRRR